MSRRTLGKDIGIPDPRDTTAGVFISWVSSNGGVSDEELKGNGGFLKVTSGTARASPSLYSPGQSPSQAQPRYTGEEEKILSLWGEFVAIINSPHLVISPPTPSLRPLTWRAPNNGAVIVASVGLFLCSLGWNDCPRNQDLTESKTVAMGSTYSASVLLGVVVKGAFLLLLLGFWSHIFYCWGQRATPARDSVQNLYPRGQDLSSLSCL